MTKQYIKKLSEDTINKIAAGEVVDRPASVIKELVENSIDAGATEIKILIEEAGKNYIKISDNGKGMPKEDLVLSVERHTTSKLKEEDITDIRNFGFRGEALPSISSIAKVKITSSDISKKAYELIVEGGEKKEPSRAIHNIGTTIEVRDLFYRTPARLKFLKTFRTEASACIDIVKKIAMSHSHIKFSLISNSKEILNLKASDELSSNDEISNKRISDIIGEDFIRNSVKISHKDNLLEFRGYASLPTFNKATSEDQYLFVNNRPVKDKLLLASVRAAYQDYLARGRHPVLVLFMNINPHMVDVNVHPAKSEVRFRESNEIRNALIFSLRNALSTGAHKVSDTYDNKLGEILSKNNNVKFTHNANILNKYNSNKNLNTSNSYSNSSLKSYNNQNNFQKETNFDKNYLNNSINDGKNINNEFNSNKENLSNKESLSYNQYNASKRNDDLFKASGIAQKPLVRPNDNVDNSYLNEDNTLGAACAQVHKNYIISQTKEGVIIVDQHAAHERLVYEDLKKQINNKSVLKQRLLIPEIVEFEDQKRINLLLNNKEKLLETGLNINKFGDKSIIVYETPTIIGEVNIKALINDIADTLLEYNQDEALSQLIEHITETYACHHSIRSGRNMNIEEMNSLLRKMEQTPYSGQCNHGRPTYIKLSLKDIEKLFGRI